MVLQNGSNCAIAAKSWDALGIFDINTKAPAGRNCRLECYLHQVDLSGVGTGSTYGANALRGQQGRNRLS